MATLTDLYRELYSDYYHYSSEPVLYDIPDGDLPDDSYDNEAFSSAVPEHFSQKISVFIDNGNFIIKTAENSHDLHKVLRLRHEVFYREMLNIALPGEIDMDSYDNRSDHLMIIDKNTDALAGTYRFNSNLFSNDFYSAGEFDISKIIMVPGVKLELGRACIAREYRSGHALMLLWTGLNEYIRASRADYVFGCSSVKTTNFKKAALIFAYLRERHYSDDELRVFPREKHRIKNFNLLLEETGDLSDEQKTVARKFLPPLVSGYLTAGAVICGEPVYDDEFKCVDFLTCLETKKLNQNYVRVMTMNGK